MAQPGLKGVSPLSWSFIEESSIPIRPFSAVTHSELAGGHDQLPQLFWFLVLITQELSLAFLWILLPTEVGIVAVIVENQLFIEA